MHQKESSGNWSNLLAIKLILGIHITRCGSNIEIQHTKRPLTGLKRLQRFTQIWSITHVHSLHLCYNFFYQSHCCVCFPALTLSKHACKIVKYLSAWQPMVTRFHNTKFDSGWKNKNQIKEVLQRISWGIPWNEKTSRGSFVCKTSAFHIHLCIAGIACSSIENYDVVLECNHNVFCNLWAAVLCITMRDIDTQLPW